MISQEVLVPETDLKPIDDIEEVGDQQDDECVECYYEADSRKDLEVHDDGYNERRNLELMVCRQSFECEDCDTKSNVEGDLYIHEETTHGVIDSNDCLS